MLDNINFKIISLRHNWKAERLPNGVLSINPNDSLEPTIVELNISKRLKHLSIILFELKKIYFFDKDFYGEAFLRFVSTQIIKEWLWIDDNLSNCEDKNIILDHKYFMEIFNDTEISSEEILSYLVKFRKRFGTNWKKHLFHSQRLPIYQAQSIYDIKKSKHNLSIILSCLYSIYRENEILYGKKFLAFVGNWVVRNWPRKDFPFDSINYNPNDKSTYEHWTPISFFRDLFSLEVISQQDFFDALVYYYRIVKISKEENDLLDNSGFKTTRPFDTYDSLNIRIKNRELWEEMYSEIDKIHTSYSNNLT